MPTKKKSTEVKWVRYTLDPANPPRMTPEQMARLEAMTDEDIDYSDIPDTSGRTGWTRPGALVATENKKQVTVRLDSDVLQFFKGTGKKYQSRMNAVLREYMLAHTRTAPQVEGSAAARKKAS